MTAISVCRRRKGL